MGATYGGKGIEEAGRITVFVQETPVYDESVYPPVLLGVSRSLVTGTDSATSAPIQFSGSFSGDATNLTVNNISRSQSMSTVSGIMAGAIAPGAWGGRPYSASVAFTTASGYSNYSVSIISEDIRAWSIESKATSSFIIQTNSSFTYPQYDVMWSVIPHVG